MNKKLWYFVVFIITTAIFAGCEIDFTIGGDAPNDEVKANAMIIQPVEPEVGVDIPTDPCGKEEYILWTDQETDAGNVVFANDDSCLYIEINLEDGVGPIEDNVKIWLGTDAPAGIFNTRPTPSQMPYIFTASGESGFTVKFDLEDFGVLPAGCDSDEPELTVLYAIVQVDAADNNETYSYEYDDLGNVIDSLPDTRTAFAGDSTGTGDTWWYYLSYVPQCCIDSIEEEEKEEVCYELQEETAWGGDTEGNGKPWWFFYDGSGVQTIRAGQTIDAGTVVLDSTTLKITLSDGWELQDDEEAVKIQGYNNDELPGFRPAAGLFKTYKGSSLEIEVGAFDLYAIHLDLQKWMEVDCPGE